MSITEIPKDHPEIKQRKTGIVIANLGTPDATDYRSMRRYLNEFLSDKRVIDYPSWKWQPILQGIILTVRPRKSGAAYDSIWDKEHNESPLMVITRRQCAKIAEAAKAEFGEKVVVDFAMRYGNPSIESVMQKLFDQGVDRVLFFPLYPQYAAPTTATANDQAFRALMKMNWQPYIRTVPAYFEEPLYIKALANSIEQGLRAAKDATKLVFSYHGVPTRYLTQGGDPYHCQCQKSTRLIQEYLKLDPDFVQTTFQSKFGPEEWVGPASVEYVAKLAEEGHKSIAIVAPAFSADCVETLEEIQEEIRDAFIEAGGEKFSYIPCLNDRDDHIEALMAVIGNEIQGWV